MRVWLVLVCLVSITASAQPAGSLSDDLKLPPYYVVKSRCIAERGYVALAEAPGHSPELPLLGLFVYRGEVVGALFEAHEKDGWRPWYNEPEGKPVSHNGGPRHYSHTVMFKKGPTAEECKAASGPLQR